MLLLLCLIAVGVVYGVIIYPKQKAERDAKRQAEIQSMQAETDSLLNISNIEQPNEKTKVKEENVTNEVVNETTEEVTENTAAEEKANNNIETIYYKIQDPDGYSNLRDKPNGEVLKKVYDTETFEIIGEEGKYKKVKLSDGTEGFIHDSRIVKAE